MRQSIGYTYTLNIIIIFILLAFAFLMAIMSYSKAYRTSSKIINSIEKCEGYNECARADITRSLPNMGYGVARENCPSRTGFVLLNNNNASDDNYGYCVYRTDTNANIQGSRGYCEGVDGCGYDRYLIVTYMTFEFPIVSRARIPISNSTDWIYRFPNDRR